MGKLTDLIAKGARLIVADDAGGKPPAPPAEPLDLPPELAEPLPAPVRSELPADVTDFTGVYDEAGIALPAHGYGIEKVIEMLQGRRLQPLAREVKATAVMAALDAAGVPMQDVVDDAVARDRALDAFEAGKQAELRELQKRSEARIQQIKQEIDAFLKQKSDEMEALKRAADQAAQSFAQLQARKRREEERLHEAVSHFVEPTANPITTSPSSAAATAGPRSEGAPAGDGTLSPPPPTRAEKS